MIKIIPAFVHLKLRYRTFKLRHRTLELRHRTFKLRHRTFKLRHRTFKLRHRNLWKSSVQADAVVKNQLGQDSVTRAALNSSTVPLLDESLKPRITCYLEGESYFPYVYFESSLSLKFYRTCIRSSWHPLSRKWEVGAQTLYYVRR